MEICSREEPPEVGGPDRFAACWWVQQHATGSVLEEATNERTTGIGIPA